MIKSQENATNETNIVCTNVFHEEMELEPAVYPDLNVTSYCREHVKWPISTQTLKDYPYYDRMAYVLYRKVYT